MTRFLSVGAKLSLAFVAVAAVALGVVYIGVVPLLQRNLSEAKLDQFTRLALGEWRSFPAGSDFGLGNVEYRLEVSQYLQDAAATTNARVVLLSPLASSQLRVLGDSRETSSAPDVSADQVALGAVLAARPVSDVVTRDGKRYAEVAVPVQTGTLDTTVLLFVSPLEDTLATVDLVKKRMLIAGGIALLLAVLLGYGGASWFSRRVKKLERAANRIALGELGEPVVDSGADELSELAMAFERMRQRLVQLEHARREFIANASHELRTPLFSLGGFLELLDDEDLDEDTRREFLVTMQGQVERLTKLATDLLDLSRLDAGRLHITLEPIDLVAVAEALASEFAALALGSDHPITVDADEHAACSRRRRACAAGGPRARRERVAAHTVWHADPDPGAWRQRPGGARDPGRRAGHSARAPRARVRALLPDRGRPGLRKRARARDRAGAGSGDGRHARGGVETGAYRLLAAPAGLGAARGGGGADARALVGRERFT